MRFKLSLIAVSLLLSMSALVSAQESTYTPVFTEGACPPTMPIGVEATCGTLTVPEDRTQPEAGAVELALAILHHPSGEPADDPIIYLEGGPGGSTFAQLNIAYPLVFQEFHEASGRDLILFDQRGVGLSTPELACPEINSMALETLDYRYEGEDLTASQVAELLADATLACGERLQGEVNLAMYTTRQNASDVADIRTALGYDEVNLWGISYGSKLALITMREHPEGIRSVIIDAILPPEIDFLANLPRNGDRAFNVLFDRCEADSACNATYPNLRDVFWNLYDRLQEEPLRINTINPLNAQPVTDAVFDGVALSSFLFQFLYQTDVLPYLPRLIYALDAGDYRTAELYIQLSIQQLELMTIGMNVAFQCQDEVPFVDVDTTLAELEAFPRSGVEYSLTGLLALDYCAAFNFAELDPSANEAVVSDIPTLVLSGEFDPITPPENGDLVVQNLANGYAYTFIGTGHGASISDPCPIGMSVAFLNNPAQAPDASCMDGMNKPQFVTADTPPPPVTLSEGQLGNATVLLPEGWIEIQAGVFARQDNPLDQGVLLTFSDLPLGRDVFILTFAAGIGAPPPEIDTTLTLDSGEWAIYITELQGYPARIAANRDDNGLQVFIIVGNDEADITYLYENLLLESLASYRR